MLGATGRRSSLHGIGVIWGLQGILGLYWDGGKLNGNYYLGFR